jgi:hypothetical protein
MTLCAQGTRPSPHRSGLLGALGPREAMSVVLVTPVAKPPPAKP